MTQHAFRLNLVAQKCDIGMNVVNALSHESILIEEIHEDATIIASRVSFFISRGYDAFNGVNPRLKYSKPAPKMLSLVNDRII
jgi:hypothetical protein